MLADLDLPENPEDMTLLSGRENWLWRWGHCCLAGEGRPDWLSYLTNWLAGLGNPSLWLGYGSGADTAPHLACAMGHVILSAGFIAAQSADDFLTHLGEACRSYTAALAGSSSLPDPPLVLLKNNWGDDSKPAFRLGLANDFLNAAAEKLPREAVAMVRSALSDLLEPGEEERVLLGRRRHKVRLPVAFVLDGPVALRLGHAATLSVEWFVGPVQGPILLPNPADLGCTVRGDDFCQAERDAWEVARFSFRDGGLVRWGLDLSPGADTVVIDGPSAGGALAVALVALAEGRRLDQVAVLACLKKGVRFGQVDGVPAKARGAHRKGVSRVVLWLPDKPMPADDPAAQITQELSGLAVERLGSVREAVDRLSGRVQKVVAFLREYARLSLKNSLVFPPPGRDLADLEEVNEFCQPTQVITDHQWRRLHEQAERNERRLRAPEERDYVPLTYLTYELGLSNGERIVPRDLERELSTQARPHTLLRGEPGEGKTTALRAYVARTCLRVAGRIEVGELAADGPEVRVPLALALQDVRDIDLSGALPKAARRAAVELVYGPGEEEPPEVREWLDGRIGRADRAGYELCLDALDELVSQDGAGGRRRWLKGELQRAARIPVLLTSRLTANVDGLLTNPNKLRVVCFGPRQVRAYVAGYFRGEPHRAAEVLRRLALAPGPRHLAQVPLLLAALCATFEVQARLDDRSLTTRTDLLRLGLQSLFVEGDRRRGHDQPREARNLAKERILYHVAWEFHAAEPHPIRQEALIPLLEALLGDERGRIRVDLPARVDALVREFEQDGVLVPLEHSSRRFVLRSFHEYCLAGWIARESPPARSGDRVAFGAFVLGGSQEWGRPGRDWAHLRPFSNPSWSNVWPLVAGHLRDRAGWLLGLYEDDMATALVAAEAPEGCEERTALLNRLAALLHAPDSPESVRERCAEALGSVGGAEALAALLERLHDADTPENVREGCAEALGRLGGAEAVAALVERLHAPDTPEEVRQKCAEALGSVAGGEALAALLERLHDADTPEKVREGCAEVLGRLGGAEALAALVERLHDADTPEKVRERCAEALGSVGGAEALAALLERLRDPDTLESVREQCAWVLGQLGGAVALAALLERLRDPDTPEEVRRGCAGALGSVGGAEALAALLERLRDPDTLESVRRGCAEALGSVAGGEALAALAERLRDPGTPEWVRQTCAEALRRVGGAEALAALAEGLRDPGTPEWVRRECAEALERLGGAEALAALVERLHDAGTPEEVRKKCARALGELGGAVAQAALLERLHDAGTPEEVREGCAEALGSVGGAEALAALLERLRDSDTPEQVRRACADGLEKLGGADAVAALAECMHDAGTPEWIRLWCVVALWHVGGAEAEAALAERLRDPDTLESVREQCAWVLGELGGAVALAALLERLHDPDTPESVRRKCATELGRVGGEEALAALVERLRDPGTPESVRQECADALGTLCRAEAVEALLQRLHDAGTPEGLRQTCAGALEALAALVERLHDPGTLEGLRQTYAGVLGSVGLDAVAALAERLRDPGIPEGLRQTCERKLESVECAAVAALKQRLHDDRPPQALRQTCAEALGRVGGVTALVAFVNCLRDPGIPEGLRQTCERELGRLGGAAAVAALAEHLWDPDTQEWVRLGCVEALEALAALVGRLHDPGTLEGVRRWCAGVRRACADGLEVVGEAEALVALLRRLHAPDTPEWLWQFCAALLGSLGGAVALAALLERLHDPGTPEEVQRGCAGALGSVGLAALAALLRRLHDPVTSEEARQWCAAALGRLGGAVALDALRLARDDPTTSATLRLACAKALGE